MVKVKLTERGGEVVRSLKEIVTEVHKTQFKSLTVERVQTLRQGLRDLLKGERPEFVAKDQEGGGRAGHAAMR